MFAGFSILDGIALGVFIAAWLGFDLLFLAALKHRPSLSDLMAKRRREWMLVLAERDLRMIDTAVLNGLQQGAAFFGSASILAIGGCFALLGSTDQVIAIVRDLPLSGAFSRALFETKVFGLTCIFIYAFFKFGWSYRLFNYCAILIGAVPHKGQGDDETRRAKALRAAEMNIIASRHFTAGMRGIFFGLAYLGWFIGPDALIASTVFVLAVLTRRQFFSKARAVVADDL